MASSFSRKSNSSASSGKPTYRRSSSHAQGRATRSNSNTSLSRVSHAPSRPASHPSSSTGRYRASVPTSRPRTSGQANLAKRGNVSMRRYNASDARRSMPHGYASGASAASRSRVGASSVPPSRRPQPQRTGRDRSRDRAASRPRRRISLPSLSGWPARIVLAVVLLGVVGFIVYSILFSSELFAATDIQINGSEHISQETAQRLIELPDDVTLFNVSDDEIIQDLKKSPWVKGVDIQRQFPHTLIITPTERTVAAIVYIAADDVAWAVSDDGTWIAPVSLSVAIDTDGNVVDATGMSAVQDSSSTDDSADSGSLDASDSSDDSDTSGDTTDSSTDSADAQDTQTQTADGYTLLTGEEAARAVAERMGASLFLNVGTDVSPSSGNSVTTEALLVGLKYVNGFSSEFLAQIKSFSLPSVQAAACHLANGVEVALGDAEDIEKKERVVTELLNKQSDVTYINVRTPDAYTYRAAQL